MKTVLFNFGAMGAANDKSIAEITKRFMRAGASVVESEVGQALIKRAGVAYRPVHFTFADGQTVTLGVKETGDVFEVRINGAPVPIRNQDDHTQTVLEIAMLLDRRRSAFQRAMARIKMPLPKIARASRSTVIAAKTAKRDALKEAIKLAEEELNELSTTSA